MEINILNNEKNEIELEIESMTISELLRVYLNKDSSVSFAAWRREHPTKKPVLKVKTSGKTAKKAVDDAVSLVNKDLDKLLANFEKLR